MSINTKDEVWDIQKIRKEFADLLHDLNWHRDRSLLPYDWNSYEQEHLAKLLDLLKINWDEHLKKQDKKGAWR